VADILKHEQIGFQKVSDIKALPANNRHLTFHQTPTASQTLHDLNEPPGFGPRPEEHLLLEPHGSSAPEKLLNSLRYGNFIRYLLIKHHPKKYDSEKDLSLRHF
jgi:hypothetical protein